jgi:hypothetical protein
LTLSLLANPRENAEGALKTYDLFIYGDIHYITNPFIKKSAKNSNTLTLMFM